MGEEEPYSSSLPSAGALRLVTVSYVFTAPQQCLGAPLR